jgi:RNA polymerase sigma factor (sigma-70 family)
VAQPIRDERWLASLFDEHALSIHRFIRRRVSGHSSPAHDADDLTAEVFAIAWRRRHEVDDPALPWLYGVARKVVAGAQRGRVDLPIADPVDEEVAVDVAELVTEDEQLRQAWSTLSPRDREVLMLAAWEGLGEQQIAAVLGLSVGGASAAQSRARARFAKALADE